MTGYPRVLSGSSPAKVVLLFEVVHSVAQITTAHEGVCGTTLPRLVSVSGEGTQFMSADFCGGSHPDAIPFEIPYATGVMDNPWIHMPDAKYDLSMYEGDGRHQGGANFLLADGHAKWLSPKQVSTGGDALFPIDEPDYALPPGGGTIRAAGSENAHFAATFSGI
jgi:prepilin-type processing-associated H-X9-DG protein